MLHINDGIDLSCIPVNVLINFQYNSEYRCGAGAECLLGISGDRRAIFTLRECQSVCGENNAIATACQKSLRNRVYLSLRYFFKPAQYDRQSAVSRSSAADVRKYSLPISASRDPARRYSPSATAVLAELFMSRD